MEVHPHGCGELFGRRLSIIPPYGSSPRVWGTRYLVNRPAPRNRFIPTGVGNSFFEIGDGTDNTVHPHGCGELEGESRFTACRYGSSPRVWGTLHLTAFPVWVDWFIPTGVGNSA